VIAILSETLGLPVAPYEEWLARVGNIDEAENGATLYEFFERDFPQMLAGKLILDTARTRRVSGTLRECGIVHEETIRRYVSRAV
jgi:hypothetical protein